MTDTSNLDVSSYVPDLNTLDTLEDSRGKWSMSVFFQSLEGKGVLMHVPPGGPVHPHYHTNVWDLFIGLGGSGKVSVGEGATATVRLMHEHSFCAVPPNVVHSVECIGTEPFRFIIIHTPGDHYDYIPVQSGKRRSIA